MKAGAWLSDACAGRITTHGKDARARRAKVDAAIKLCSQDPLAQQREKRPKPVQGVVPRKESQGQQKLTFGVQQLQSRSGVPPKAAAEPKARPVKDGQPAEAAQNQSGLARWFVQPAGAIEVAAPKPDGPEHKSPASKARSRRRLGKRERAQRAAEATAQPKAQPKAEAAKRKPPPPPAGKRTGVKKDKDALGEVDPPQQAGAAVAVGDPAPPTPAKKSKRTGTGTRLRLPPAPRRLGQVNSRRRRSWMMSQPVDTGF